MAGNAREGPRVAGRGHDLPALCGRQWRPDLAARFLGKAELKALNKLREISSCSWLRTWTPSVNLGQVKTKVKRKLAVFLGEEDCSGTEKEISL